jgi:YHS domain-containing protein
MKHFLLFILLGAFTTSFGQDASTRTRHYDLEKGLAIQGYDPVAYFTLGRPQKGNWNYAYTYLGVIYIFSSPTNREIFSKSPSTFEPQYGGWCAFAMGDKGEKVEVDPETFKIVDGKLYLFYNAYFNNTLTSWNKNESYLKAKADSNWSNTLKK